MTAFFQNALWTGSPVLRSHKGYRKWRKAVQRTMDWVDDDD